MNPGERKITDLLAESQFTVNSNQSAGSLCKLELKIMLYVHSLNISFNLQKHSGMA